MKPCSINKKPISWRSIEAAIMRYKNITLLNTNNDGRVDAKLAYGTTEVILNLMSTFLKIPIEEIDASVCIEGGKYLLYHRSDGDQTTFVETNLTEIIEYTLGRVWEELFAQPGNTNFSVFSEIKISPKKIDTAIEYLNNNLQLAHNLKIPKELISKFKAKDSLDKITKAAALRNRAHLGCIASVCTHEEQPYVDFFLFDKKLMLKRYNNTISILGCSTTLEIAKELEQLRASAKNNSEKIVLRILVRKKKKFGKDYELLGYEIERPNPNLNLKFD